MYVWLIYAKWTEIEIVTKTTNKMFSFLKKEEGRKEEEEEEKKRMYRLDSVSTSGPLSLRKHAYSNILKILPPKNENFQIKYSDIFHISPQSKDCGYSLEPPRRSGSNECPQSMFLNRNMKNNVFFMASTLFQEIS